MRKFIKSAVLRLSRLSSLRKLFVLLYKAQLRIIVVALSRTPYVIAILLGRKKVFEDLFPGDSDFDLICILDGPNDKLSKALANCAATHKFLKYLCPVYTEGTKFYFLEDFKRMRSWGIGHFEPLDERSFVYKKQFLSALPEPKDFHFCLTAIKDFLLFALFGRTFEHHRPPPGNQKYFNRAIFKDLHRVRTFASMYQDQTVIERGYAEAFKDIDFYTADQNKISECLCQIFQTVASLKPGIGEEPAISFSYRDSRDTALTPSLLKSLEPGREALTKKYGAVIEEFIVCDYRPYKTCGLLLLKLREDFRWYENGDFIDQLLGWKKITPPLPFVQPHPIPLTSSMWNFIMAADPLLRFFYESRRYDLLSRRLLPRPSGETHRLNISFLKAELLRTAGLLTSMVRLNNTHYLMDLLFGHLIALKILLKKRIFYASFQDLYDNYLKSIPWNLEQRSLINLYLEGDIENLFKISSVRFWQIFSDYILAELNEARIIFDELPREKISL